MINPLEKVIDKYISETLQEKRIDFVRINNSNMKGNVNSYHTFAFDDPFSCSTYWPDFVFAFKGNVFMIENGLKVGNQIRHKKRKEMQKKRLLHWRDNGGCKIAVITSKEGAKAYFKKIKLLGV